MAGKKWKTLGKFVIGSGIALAAVIVGVCQYMAEEVYLPATANYAKEINQHQAAIIKDLKLLEASPIFKSTTGQKDAQEFLSQHISWSGQDFQPLKTPQHEVLLKFESQLKEWKESSQLQALLKQPELMQMDVSWVEELPNYDHWNFASHATIKSDLDKAAQAGSLERISILASLPIPQISELRHFTLIYFLQQYQKSNVKQGLQVLEHAAQLMHTGNTLVSQMSAVALLKTENKLKDFLKFTEPTLATEESLLAYKRVSWAWIGISNLPWFKESIAAYAPYLKAENGICAAVNEPSQDGMRDFFEPKFIFENDMSENFINLRAHHNKLRSLCHAEYLKIFDQAATNNPLLLRLPASVFYTDDAAESTSINWSRIPYVRRFVGSVVISIASPNWVSQYAKLAEAKN